jgi:hypothetical protein
VKRLIFGLFLAFGVLVGGCTSAPTAPPANPSGAVAAPPQITENTRGEIVAVYERRYDALRKRDLSAYQKTFEVTRLALRRCFMDSFDVAGRQGVPTVPDVGKVDVYGDYVRAYVNEGFGYRRLYFRKTDSGFIQSEPTDAELGAEKTKTFDGLQLAYWAIDEDIIDVIAKSSLQARASVLRNLLSPETREPFGIRFYPTRSIASVVNCAVVGSHLINTPSDPFVRMYRYWFNKDATELSPDTITFIQHEGLHWAQDQFIPAINVRLPWFLAEGWPDYIGESRSLPTMRNVICNTPTPTFKQLADGLIITPETPQELPGQYYSFANTMVEYLYLQFGKDAYPRLLTAYKDGVNAEVNFPKVLGVTPAQFYDGWLAFAKKKYC